MFVKTNTKIFNARAKKIFFPTSLRKALEAQGLDLERNMTYSGLLVINEILLAFSQVVRVLRSALTFEQRDLMVFAKMGIVCKMECLWKLNENLIAICRSLMYSKNNRGPSTEPWGAPCLIDLRLDSEFWIDTNWCLSDKYDICAPFTNRMI